MVTSKLTYAENQVESRTLKLRFEMTCTCSVRSANSFEKIKMFSKYPLGLGLSFSTSFIIVSIFAKAFPNRNCMTRSPKGIKFARELGHFFEIFGDWNLEVSEK